MIEMGHGSVRFGSVQSLLLFDNHSVPLSPQPGRKCLITGCCCMSRLGPRCSGWMLQEAENLKIMWRLPLSEEMASSCGTLENILPISLGG